MIPEEPAAAPQQPTPNQSTQIESGGAYIGGDASAGGDLVGRDKISGDKVEIHHHYGPTPQPAEPPQPLPAVPCPYRGLEYFDVSHATNYFGRGEMTEKLLAKVQECNFIAVVGPSGSGKSSLVRAGMMVALQGGAIAGSRDWRLEIFRPGENPLLALAGRLLQLDPLPSNVDRWIETEKLAKRLGDGELSIRTVLEQVRGSMPKLLLIVDQFEETFTLCSDEALRTTFLDILLTATEKPWLTVLFTLRADFYGRVLEREALSKRVDAGLVNVLPMTHDERRAAIEQPALQAGRRFESGLVERIVAAVEAEPGQLPLLEFALTELWERQTADGRLTHAAYEAIGEVSGAIAKRADDTLRSLSAADQEWVRTIFTRLVRVAPPDEGGDDTKRRLALAELDPTLHPLVQKLADARLLVTGRDEQQKNDTVEVAHEALIRGWGALQTWLNSDREFLLWRQRLHSLEENWSAAHKDEGSLLRGTTLGEAEGYLAARASELSVAEREFVEKSRALAIQEAHAKEAAALQLRRRNQFLRVALTVAIVALTVAIYFWDSARDSQQLAEGEVIVRSTAEALAVTREAQANGAAIAEANQRATAETETVRADQNAQTAARAQADAERTARRAQAGEMAVRVQAELARELTESGVTSESTILLARDAVLTTLNVDHYVMFNADTILRDAVDNATWRMTLPAAGQRHQSAVNDANFSPDGKSIVSAGDDNTVRIWEAASLRPVKILVGHTGGVLSAVFSPDGKTIVSASADQTVKLWDAVSGKQVRTLSGHAGGVWSAVFSPDGKTIVSASNDQTIKLWDAASGKQVYTLSGHKDYVRSAVFSLDGKTIVSASYDQTVKLWDAASGKQVRTLSGHTGGVLSAAFSPDGKTIVSASVDQTIKLWDAASGKEVYTLSGHAGSVWSAVFSPDGKTIVSASNDQTIKLWDAASGKQVRAFSGHTDYVQSVAFSPDGKTIVSASADQTIKLWDAASGTELRTLSGHTGSVRSVAFSPDGKWIVSASDDQTVRIWVASIEDLLQMAEARIQRPVHELTEEERRQYGLE